MKASDIRNTFLKFFEERGHAIIPSAPVVPQHDPTVLFTTAGMHPLVPYLLGEPHPAGKRLADVQKCIRTSDIDEVGDATHLTFFEMLGNWSLGDYFKEDAIKWSWELLTSKDKGFGLDLSNMAVSCFVGDKDAPKDKEAAEVWRKLGVPEDRIFYYGKDDNWWGPAGETGPCGPDTEIFYWIGDGKPELKPGPAEDDQRWVEVWNNVFMQYEKTADGKYEPLAQKNVDTGLGLERLAVILQGKRNVYETDLFAPILDRIRKLSNVDAKVDNPELQRAEQIIADHLKAATFMIADGVRPSNTDQGYILRRLIRRAIRQAKHLKIEYPFSESVAETVVSEFKDSYPELEREAGTIREELLDEEKKFVKTLDRGLKELGQLSQAEKITGRELFYYFETYGLPLEVSLEELAAKSTTESIYKQLAPGRLREEFDAAQKAHQEKSRAGSKQKFAGGLADHSEKVVRQHTATHLLLAALRDVLGEHVKQRGSNITAERLRFDFSHPEKLTDEQRNQVEALVNEWIREDLPVTRREMPLKEAERIGAQMEFGHKYPDTVSVYFVGDPAEARSIEFCGGPHVERTGQIGKFTIKKQESVGAGVRRLKAVVE
ncbi:MAG: alanine--tRNA ligase [bacterium]|nr:alanine--tRNA ligase [bacterium]MDZ4247963.1 alanine--tRNA ligase [Patescibacteria group bacterium]